MSNIAVTSVVVIVAALLDTVIRATWHNVVAEGLAFAVVFGMGRITGQME